MRTIIGSLNEINNKQMRTKYLNDDKNNNGDDDDDDDDDKNDNIVSEDWSAYCRKYLLCIINRFATGSSKHMCDSSDYEVECVLKV